MPGERENCRKCAKKAKFDNDTIRKVTKVVRYHDLRMPATAKSVRRAMNQIGEELFPYYMEVRRADVLAQSMYQREEKIENLGSDRRIIPPDRGRWRLRIFKGSGSDRPGSDRLGHEAWQGNWRETGGIAETGHRGSQIKYKGRTAETAELKKNPLPLIIFSLFLTYVRENM